MMVVLVALPLAMYQGAITAIGVTHKAELNRRARHECDWPRQPFVGKLRSVYVTPYSNTDNEQLQFGNIIVALDQPNLTWTWIAPEFGHGRPQDHGAERGMGTWVVKPEFKYSNDGREWTSRAFSSERVPSANHTSCCCQYMHSSKDTEFFTITDFCKVLVPGLESSLLDTCLPYSSSACPADNATASAMAWPIKMYTEVYRACYL